MCGVSHSGLLTCSELYGGLEWLGLSLTPDQIYAIVLYIDIDRDYLVSFEASCIIFRHVDVINLCDQRACPAWMKGV